MGLCFFVCVCMCVSYYSSPTNVTCKTVLQNPQGHRSEIVSNSSLSLSFALCKYFNNCFRTKLLKNRHFDSVIVCVSQHIENIDCRYLILKNLLGGRTIIQARQVNCIRWHKIHSICDFSVHVLPNVCTSQLDHNTQMTFSNGSLCKLCCNSVQTNLCQRRSH